MGAEGFPKRLLWPTARGLSQVDKSPRQLRMSRGRRTYHTQIECFFSRLLEIC